MNDPSHAEAGWPSGPIRFLRSPVTWCFALAGLVRAALTRPDFTADSWRFIRQAQGFLAGQGFGDVTDLPPGYSVFLALLSPASRGSVDAWVNVALAANVLMSLASCYLVYAAIRPKSPKAALVGFACMAVSPILARLAGYLLSETFSTFLTSLIFFEVSRFEERGPNIPRSLFLGFLCMAILLTAPATLILAFLVWCYLAYNSRRSLANLAALAVGSLLLMVPWQIHCYRATGKIQPTVYSTFHRPSGFALWCRTWVATQGDMGVWWHPKEFQALPDTLFASPAQRAELTALYHKEGVGRLSFRPELSQPFLVAAEERVARNPRDFYLVLPAKRAFFLWFDADYGWNKAIQQLQRFPITRAIADGRSASQKVARSIVGGVGFLAHNGGHLLLLVVAILGLWSRRIMPWLVVSAVVGYTAISAVGGMGEFRRDLPFYPAILFILYYLADEARRPAGDAARPYPLEA